MEISYHRYRNALENRYQQGRRDGRRKALEEAAAYCRKQKGISYEWKKALLFAAEAFEEMAAERSEGGGGSGAV